MQGPPGTGKSTTIYHIISTYVPRGAVVLATCVQNKAVDAIQKLAQERDTSRSSSLATPSAWGCLPSAGRWRLKPIVTHG